MTPAEISAAQSQMARLSLDIFFAEAERREQQALDDYTDAVKLADADAKAAALDAFERAHQDCVVIDDQRKALEAER